MSVWRTRRIVPAAQHGADALDDDVDRQLAASGDLAHRVADEAGDAVLGDGEDARVDFVGMADGGGGGHGADPSGGRGRMATVAIAILFRAGGNYVHGQTSGAASDRRRGVAARARPARDAGRIAIVRLLDASTVPLTLADIHEKVRAKGCDFATVFRFISILEEKELVQRVAWIDGTTRHEMSARDGHQHHHYLICRDVPQDRADRRMRGGELRGPDREGARLRGPEPFAAAFRRVPRVPKAGREIGPKKRAITAANRQHPCFARDFLDSRPACECRSYGWSRRSASRMVAGTQASPRAARNRCRAQRPELSRSAT